MQDADNDNNDDAADNDDDNDNNDDDNDNDDDAADDAADQRYTVSRWVTTGMAVSVATYWRRGFYRRWYLSLSAQRSTLPR